MACTMLEDVVVWLRGQLDSRTCEFLAQRLAIETPDLHHFLRLGFEERVKELLCQQGRLAENEINECWYEFFLAAVKHK